MSIATKTWTWASTAESWADGGGSGDCTAQYQGSDGNGAGCFELAASGRKKTGTEYGYVQDTFANLFGIADAAEVTDLRITDLDRKVRYCTDINSASLDGIELWQGGAKIGDLWTGESITATTSWTSLGAQSKITGLEYTGSTTIQIRIYMSFDLQNTASAGVTWAIDNFDLEVTYALADSPITGTITVTFGSTADLNGTGALAGTIAATTATSADLKGTGTLSGTSTVSFGATANVRSLVRVRTIGSGGDYALWSSWESGTQGDQTSDQWIDEGRLLNGTVTEGATVSASGSTTNGTYYRRIVIDSVGYDPLNDTGPKLLSNTTGNRAFNQSEAYFQLIGPVAIEYSGPATADNLGNWAISQTGSIANRVCLIDSSTATSGGATRHGLQIYSGIDHVRNIIIIGSGSTTQGSVTAYGIYALDDAYNVTTVLQLRTGSYGAYTAASNRNVISMGNATAFHASSGGNYHIDDDNTAPGANSQHNQVVTDIFYNWSAGDYRVALDGNAIDTGESQSGIFTDDFEGNTRSGGWEVGAFDESATPPGAISGTIAVTFSASADLNGTGALEGTVVSAFASTAALLGIAGISGSTYIRFDQEFATLTGTGSLAGTIPAVFSETASLVGTGSLAGTTPFVFSTQADLSGIGAISGTIAAIFSTEGALVAVASISATTYIRFDQEFATLTGTGSLAGTLLAVFSEAASLTGSGALAGTIPFVFDTSGDLTSAGSTQYIAGTIPVVFTSSAALSGTGLLAGTTPVVFGSSAALTGSGSLSGSLAFVFDQSGFLQGVAPISGTIPAVFDTSAALAGTGAVSGSTYIRFDQEFATLTGTGSLTGTTAFTFATSADLTIEGAGYLAGTIAVSFTASAGLGALIGVSGTSVMVFSTSAGLMVLLGAAAYMRLLALGQMSIPAIIPLPPPPRTRDANLNRWMSQTRSLLMEYQRLWVELNA